MNIFAAEIVAEPYDVLSIYPPPFQILVQQYADFQHGQGRTLAVKCLQQEQLYS